MTTRPTSHAGGGASETFWRGFHYGVLFGTVGLATLIGLITLALLLLGGRS